MDCFCSNCGKKYSINPSKIPAGRKYAKCKACGGKIPLRAAKKCGKCGYIRKSTDTAPDWECPECGIVYEKIESVTQNKYKVDKKTKDTSRKDKENKQNKIKHDAKEEDSNTPSTLNKKKFDYNKYILLYVFFSLVIGYFAGREHVKYEMRRIFKSGIKSFADGINRGGDSKSSRVKVADEKEKTEQKKREAKDINMCKEYASFAMVVMKKRQEEVPMYKLLEIARDNQDKNAVGLLEMIVEQAYSEHAMRTQENRERQQNAFSNKIFRQCYNSN